MTEREQLELAAKAAGYEVVQYSEYSGLQIGSEWWDPRDDDGDALRLAVKLSIDLEFGDESDMHFVKAEQSPFVETDGVEVCEYSGFRDGSDGVLKATRLAIFKAAVEIGRNMS